MARLAGKTVNKPGLQKDLGLPVAKTCPLFGTISRLAEQKGVDIQLGALEEMLGADMQFVLLGSGSPDYERGYHTLARRFPDKVAVCIGYDENLSHRIEAACDFYLMPSQFEPCGLNQMYSLRYGTIPIVRATGGLDDSVIDYTQDAKRQRHQISRILADGAGQGDSQGAGDLQPSGIISSVPAKRDEGGFFLGKDGGNTCGFMKRQKHLAPDWPYQTGITPLKV